MYGVAVIPVERAEAAVVIPREAVTTHDGRRVVLKLENDVVRVVAVKEGASNGVLVQIVEGLSPGDAVVADARRDLVDGVRVRPITVN